MKSSVLQNGYNVNNLSSGLFYLKPPGSFKGRFVGQLAASLPVLKISHPIWGSALNPGSMLTRFVLEKQVKKNG